LRKIRNENQKRGMQNLYRKAIIYSILGNIILTLIKGFIAWISGSSAVFSDAANSFSDTIYSVFMGFGLYLSQRPADNTHPQGHSRFEPLVSLFIALAMVFAGVAAFWQSLQRFFTETRGITKIELVFLVLVFSILLKLVMFLLIKKLGKEAHSPAIRAIAIDNLADIWSSFAALVGVLGSRLIHPLLDPIAGLLVALWIFKAAWSIVWENLGYLTGRGASVETINKIAKTAKQVQGVEDVHKVIAEYVGPKLRIDMHIDVDGKISLRHAHKIAEEVKKKLGEILEVDLVFVHVEPINNRE